MDTVYRATLETAAPGLTQTRAAIPTPRPAAPNSHALLTVPNTIKLFRSISGGLAKLALMSRPNRIAAAFAANMAAFSLWWLLCSLAGHASLLFYLPALLLAHPVLLLALGGRTMEGIILAAGRQRVDLRALMQPETAGQMPPLEVLTGDESALQQLIGASSKVEVSR